MNWEWFSRKGNLNRENRDAGGILIKRSAILALIIDGSSKGTNGTNFVREG